MTPRALLPSQGWRHAQVSDSVFKQPQHSRRHLQRQRQSRCAGM